MKKSCVIYDSWAELIENLPDEMAGQLIKMVLGYAFGRENNKNDDPAINAMFSMIKTKIDEDNCKYQEKVERIKNNSSRNRNDIDTKSERNQNDVESVSVSVSVSEYVSDKEVKEKDKKEKRFVKPSVDDVREYCKERHNDVDPDMFVDFYASKGWKVGKEPMKDWKACIRTWEKRGSPKKPASNPKIHNYEEREYDFDELQKLATGSQ